MAGSTMIASVRYRDAPAAIAWLETVFGFHPHAVYHGPDNTVAHAELTLGEGMVMLGSASNASPHSKHVAHPDEAGGRVTSVFYVIVSDCAAAYEQAKQIGANIVQGLETMSYGGQGFAVLDPEGYLWAVGEYNPWTAGEASSGAGESR